MNKTMIRHTYKQRTIELYDGNTGGPYNGGRYLSAAIHSPAQSGGAIVLPTLTMITEQSLQAVGLGGKWKLCHCLGGKHTELYDEQSPCVCNTDADFNELCRAALILFKAYDLNEALVKDSSTGKVVEVKRNHPN